MFQQLLYNGIIAGSIYALIALGFGVIYRTVRFFHFAHGVVYAAGAYLAYSFFIQLGMLPIVSCLLSIVSAAILGILIDRFIYLPLRRRNAPNLIFLLASFGIFIFLQNFIQLLYGAQILTLNTGPVKEGHEFLGAVITDTQILIIGVCFSLFAAVWLFTKATKLGKAMRAVANNPVLANISGINSERIILYSFAIGSGLAGLAGILISLETNIEPTMGMNAMLKGLTAAIIGGMGSIPGALLGGLLLGFAENFGIWYIQAGWKDAIAFGMLIIFLLFRPQGILGKRKD